MVFIALAVCTTSKGPALFAQTRIGQGGRPFKILKFRTMRNGSSGSALTAPGDARVTRLGRVLRASCLDEIPQLFNILAGHMTLVGPRPQTPGFVARYPAHLREIFQYRPGLTGPGVLRFNDEDVLPAGEHTSKLIEELYLRLVVPNRVAVDLEFCRQATLRRTLAVLWETAALAPHRFLSRKPDMQKVITLPDVHTMPQSAPEGAPARVPASARTDAENAWRARSR